MTAASPVCRRTTDGTTFHQRLGTAATRWSALGRVGRRYHDRQQPAFDRTGTPGLLRLKPEIAYPSQNQLSLLKQPQRASSKGYRKVMLLHHWNDSSAAKADATFGAFKPLWSMELDEKGLCQCGHTDSFLRI